MYSVQQADALLTRIRKRLFEHPPTPTFFNFGKCGGICSTAGNEDYIEKFGGFTMQILAVIDISSPPTALFHA